MQIKDAEVALTVEIRGAQASRGRYNFSPKMDENGKPMMGTYQKTDGTKDNFPLGRVETVEHRKFHKSSQHTVLNNKFVQHAISDEGKPYKMGRSLWHRLSKKQRLEFHIKKYAQDMFPGCRFTYSIIG